MNKQILIGLVLVSLILISGCKTVETKDTPTDDIKTDDTKIDVLPLSKFEKFKEDVPKDETVLKILKQCEDEMNKQISECETKKGMIDIMMSVSDMNTLEEKDFQKIAPGGCEKEDERITITTKLIDSQSLNKDSQFQVLCSINCYARECKKEITEGKNCQQPPVRSCNTECEHLPSYPTYEKEDCIEQCIAEDKASWSEYNLCVES